MVQPTFNVPATRNPTSILHRARDNLSEMLTSVLARDVSNAGREVQHAPLRDRAVHERGDVRVGVPDRLQPARHAEAVEEARDGLVEVVAQRSVREVVDGGVAASEDLERRAVAVRRGGRGELEDGGCG